MMKAFLVYSLLFTTYLLAEETRKTYYPKGQLSSESNYINGIQEGIYREYHKNGNLESLGQYLNDKESGEWLFFAKDGSLVEEGVYVEGKREGLWKYYSKSQLQRGVLFEAVQYNRGLENGINATFYPDGTVRCKTSYLYGQIHGIRQSFFPSGNIRTQFSYEDGKIHGKGIAWNDEGKPLLELTYSNDKIKKEAYYDRLDRDEVIKLLDTGKREGKKGSRNHNRWFTFFPCGEDEWTDSELFDELD